MGVLSKVTIRQVEGRVIVLKDGVAVMNLEYGAALDLGNAIVTQARKAQEWANRERIVIDQAMIIRSGSSLPIATDPRIQQEALKESRWNRMLRRFMPTPPAMPDKIGNLQVQKGAAQ